MEGQCRPMRMPWKRIVSWAVEGEGAVPRGGERDRPGTTHNKERYRVRVRVRLRDRDRDMDKDKDTGKGWG